MGRPGWRLLLLLLICCTSFGHTKPPKEFIKRIKEKACPRRPHSVSIVPPLSESADWQDQLVAMAAESYKMEQHATLSKATLQQVVKYAYGVPGIRFPFGKMLREFEQQLEISLVIPVVLGAISCISAISIIGYVIYLCIKKKSAKNPTTMTYPSKSGSPSNVVSIPMLSKDRSKEIILLKFAIVALCLVILATISIAIVCIMAFFHTHDKIAAQFVNNMNSETDNVFDETFDIMCAVRNTIEHPEKNMFDAIQSKFTQQKNAMTSHLSSLSDPLNITKYLVEHFDTMVDWRELKNAADTLHTYISGPRKPYSPGMVAKAKEILDFANVAVEFFNSQSSNGVSTNIHHQLSAKDGIFKPKILRVQFPVPNNVLTNKMHDELYTIEKESKYIKDHFNEYIIDDSTWKYIAIGLMGFFVVAFALSITLYLTPVPPTIILLKSTVFFFLMIFPLVYTPNVLQFADTRQLSCIYFEQNAVAVSKILNSINASFLQRNFIGELKCDASKATNDFEILFDQSLTELHSRLDPLSSQFEKIAMDNFKENLKTIPPLKQRYSEMDQKVNEIDYADCGSYKSLTCIDENDHIAAGTRITIFFDTVNSFKEDWNCDRNLNSCKNFNIFDNLTVSLTNSINNTGMSSLLKPVHESITNVKTTLLKAVNGCELPRIYTNVLTRACDQTKPFYLLLITYYLIIACLWMFGVLLIFIGKMRTFQPPKRIQGITEKREINVENQSKFANSVGISLDCIAIDPKKTYEDFMKLSDKETSTQKSNVSNSRVESKSKKSEQSFVKSTKVDLGWPENNFNGNWVIPMGNSHKYIMTAAPTFATAVDFWHVVYRYNCKAIVMLCDFVESENGQPKEKCFKYWSEKTKLTFQNKFAKYTVKCTSVKKSLFNNLKHVVLSVSNGFMKKEIELIQYTGWQDCLAPESPEELAHVMKTLYEDIGKTSEPVVVQCADGHGRSAAFVGMDVLLSTVNADSNPEPFNLLQTMRLFRASSFTDKWQYYFSFICFFQFHIMNKSYGPSSKIYYYLIEKKASFVEKLKAATSTENRATLHQRKDLVKESFKQFQNAKEKKIKNSDDAKPSDEKERNLSGTNLTGCNYEYSVGMLLGAGTFGQVYQAKKGKQVSTKHRTKRKQDMSDTDMDVEYAVKTEKRNTACGSLMAEIFVLMEVSAHSHENRNQIVQFIDKGRTENFDFMVMSLVGKSLSTVQRFTTTKLNSFSAMYLTIQSFNAIHQLHQCGFIHRDVKPGNFAIGNAPKERVVFVLDFGMALTSFDDDGKVIPRNGKEKSFLGTMRYAPRAAHEMNMQHPRDDIESWLYMNIEMFQKLPWKGNMDRNVVMQGKCDMMEGKYWQKMESEGLPTAFQSLIKLIVDMNPHDVPDYRKLMHIMMGAECDYNLDLDWVSKTTKLHEQKQYEAQTTRATSRDIKAMAASFASQKN